MELFRKSFKQIGPCGRDRFSRDVLKDPQHFRLQYFGSLDRRMFELVFAGHRRGSTCRWGPNSREANLFDRAGNHLSRKTIIDCRAFRDFISSRGDMMKRNPLQANPVYQPAAQRDMVELIPALRAFARSLCRNTEDADDLVQETLTKAIANVDKFEAGTRLKSWLFTIMRNTFYSRIKVAARESPGALGCVSEQPSAAESQEWTQRSREVARAIDLLPEEQRQVIVLVCMIGISYDEAAEICGCQIGTIKSRINRARTNLADILGDRSSAEAADANAVIKLC
jgi:RNA polymerase sigma-70 factor (ECF subfamily)